MNMLKPVSMILALAVMLTVPTVPAEAERGRGRDDGIRRERIRRDQIRRDRDHARFRSLRRDHVRGRDWVLDRRHRHNHYYPRRGFVVRKLPRGYRVFRHHRTRYYFHDGVWYRRGTSGFVVITPPVGLTLSLLPPHYTTVWVGDVPYYYADGIYYRWRPESRVYVVSEPPAEEEVVEETALPRQLFIYPKEGQSVEQQETDRYECHRWAVDQSGFDPTLPGGNVPASQNAAKRDEYQRAMKACLEARGYSVQ